MMFHTCESRVTLEYVLGNEAHLKQWEQEILQGCFHEPAAAYRALVVAHPHDTVHISACAKQNPQTQQTHHWIDILLNGWAKPDGDPFWREYQTRYGIWRDNHGLHLTFLQAEVSWPDARGRGIGANVFAAQAEAANQFGFSTIEAAAIRRVDSNGYYTWLRLGFDCVLSAEDRNSLPSEFATSLRLSDLLRTPSGRNWWKEHGWGVHVDFDTGRDSLSMRTLRTYLDQHGWEWPSSPVVPLMIREGPAPDRGSRFIAQAACGCR